MEYFTESQTAVLEALDNNVSVRFFSHHNGFTTDPEEMMAAATWFSELDAGQAEEIIKWYNVRIPGPDDLLNLYRAVADGQIQFDKCGGCGKVWVDTGNVTDWGNFQGVSYEGCQTFTWVEGHIEGNTPLKRPACTDCEG